MCCCGKPSVNGKDVYSWDGKTFGMYPAIPPELKESDALIFDLPGRCGQIDCHSHHYRLVLSHGSVCLLVRHGAGTERIDYLSNGQSVLDALRNLDDDGQYWMLNALYSAVSLMKTESTSLERVRWQTAIVEKRVKKSRRGGRIRVWIE